MNLELKWYEAKKKLLDIIDKHQIEHKQIMLAFSGGKDSMVCYTMLKELNLLEKVKVVFSNTKMEFDAQMEFIKQLGGIEILENNTALPLIYIDYGLPLQSKLVSDMISRLQRHNFDFVNDTYKDYDYLCAKYPKATGAIAWLVGKNFTMNCPKWLKRQLKDIDFKVSPKCCTKLKKEPFKKYEKENNIKLKILGIRKAEGGLRSVVYKSCFFEKNDQYWYLPLLDFNDDEIAQLIKDKNIPLSKAYTLYGCDRTGCVGCPYAKNWEQELEILKKYEPKRYDYCMKTYKKIYDIYKK